MFVSKFSAVLALFTMGAVKASPTPEARGLLDAVCTLRDPLPSDLLCGKQGFVKYMISRAEFRMQTSSLEYCADLCMDSNGCKAFSYDGPQCHMYYDAMSNLGFVADKGSASSTWYEMDCFLCENVATLIMSEDFEDTDLAKWAIISDNIEDFAFDTQTVDSYNHQKTKALRLIEAGTTTDAEFQRTPRFQLDKKNLYQLTFYAKADARGQEWSDKDFHPITAVIWNADHTALELYLERSNFVAMGNGWYRFRVSFSIDWTKVGEYVLSFIDNSSGKQIDWYIDDISLTNKGTF